MTAQILDGKATAAAVKADLKERVAALAARGIVPGLGTILVGDDPGSHSYVAGKHRDCAQVGIASIRRDLPATASQAQVEEAVHELNEDPACTGYIVQLPLPRGLDEMAVLNLIDPAKDADGLHPVNLGKLVLGQAAPLPCTPHGIVVLLRKYGVELAGRGGDRDRPRYHGRARARPAADPQVGELDRDLVPHRDQGPRRAHPRRRHRGGGGRAGRAADRGHGQAGRGGARRGHHADRRGAGRGRCAGRGHGRGWVAPNPGGVGPMTRAMLLANVVETAERGYARGTPRSSAVPLRGHDGKTHCIVRTAQLLASNIDSGYQDVEVVRRKGSVVL